MTKKTHYPEVNPEAIGALGKSSKGNIHRTRYAAQNALSVLAEKGDALVSAALNESQAYWQAQANPSFIEQRRAAAHAAKKLEE